MKQCDTCKREIRQTEPYVTILAQWHNYGGFGSGVEAFEVRCSECAKNDIEVFKRVMRREGIPVPGEETK